MPVELAYNIKPKEKLENM